MITQFLFVFLNVLNRICFPTVDINFLFFLLVMNMLFFLQAVLIIMTTSKTSSNIIFSIQLFPFLIFGLNSRVPVSTARNVVVNRFRNKVLIGYNYRTIISLGQKRCLESCLADCRCLSFQVCGSSHDCQLSNSSKTLINGSAVEDNESCDHFELNYQDMTKIEVTFNIRIQLCIFLGRKR